MKLFQPKTPRAARTAYLLFGLYAYITFSMQDALSLPNRYSSLNGSNPVDVVVFPKNPARVNEVDKIITDTILDRSKVNKVQTIHRPEYSGIEFWRLNVDESLLERVRTQLLDGDVVIIPNDMPWEDQSSIETHSSNLSRIAKDGKPVIQKDAPDDLKVVSWPSGKSFERLLGYKYLSRQKLPWPKARIIVIDNGYEIDAASKDFDFRNQMSWEYPPGVVSKRQKDDTPIWHGTCVTVKAVGIINGVYKGANEGIMLKTAKSVSDTNWAFSRARDLTKNLPSTTIIVFPRGRSTLPGKEYPDLDRVKELIQEIFDSNGVVVVPAGNSALDEGRSKVDMLPALWTGSDFPLIVVGAVNNQGDPADFSQGGDKVSISAPGVRVSCPHDDEREFNGTSYAAPMVAGLLAYYLSTPEPPFSTAKGSVAKAARDFLISSPKAGWSRIENGPKVIWNGQDGSIDSGFIGRVETVHTLYRRAGAYGMNVDSSNVDDRRMMFLRAKFDDTAVVADGIHYRNPDPDWKK